jgi:hypothetical protein
MREITNEQADVREKNRAEMYINAWLNETFSKKTANESLWEIMTKSSAEAKRNGYKTEVKIPNEKSYMFSKSMQKALDDEKTGRITRLVNHKNAVAEILG